MPLYRIDKLRFLAYYLLEGGVMGGVLYGLAVLTLTLSPVPVDTSPMVIVGVTATVFTLVLLGTRRVNLGGAGAMSEIVVFGVVTLTLGVLDFVFWKALKEPATLAWILPLEGAVAAPFALGLWRWVTDRLGVLRGYREKVLILGTGETARQVCRWIVNQHSFRYTCVGFVDEDESRVGTMLAMGARIRTGYKRLPEVARGVDRVIVALDEKRGRLPLAELMELRVRGIAVEDSTTFIERTSGRISVETMLPSWLIYSDGFKTSPLRSLLRRLGDLALSLILLVLAWPLMAVVAILIKLDSPGPVFFRQKRMGLSEHEFTVLKFRSMREDAESSGPTWAQKDDARVTRVGKVIRLLRIDELPQLINVLRGDMSFVGPRPERRHFVSQLKNKIPYYGLRMTMRPGITGWAQVEYGYGATEQDAAEKLKYDLFYIKNNNFFLDLWIVMKTVKVVLLGSGAR